MEPQVEFIGWQLKPRQVISIAEELEEESLVTIHITQLALGDAADNSRHTVFITNDKGRFAIGTLDKDRPHFSVDFMAAEADLKLSHTGRIFCTFTSARYEMPVKLDLFQVCDMLGSLLYVFAHLHPLARSSQAFMNR